MMWDIYDALVADDVISPYKSNIKFYEYPATGDVSTVYIIIDPLDAPIPGDFADNKWLTDDYMYQIEVWSNDINNRDKVASRIRDVLWNIGIGQFGGGADEYDEGVFRDARRYRGKKILRSDYIGNRE